VKAKKGEGVGLSDDENKNVFLDARVIRGVWVLTGLRPSLCLDCTKILVHAFIFGILQLSQVLEHSISLLLRLRRV
jgi:hypothetical protein